MIPAVMFRQRVTVERLAGQGAYGPHFGAPQPDVRASVEGGSRLVRDSGGNEVVSTRRVHVPGTYEDVPPGSMVSDPGRWRSRVIGTVPHYQDGNSLSYTTLNLE